ncbi:MAG: InlB B-repeat-containing protein [Lachnospiraceae bacterium]|nr:InlB B-repeat-containing protein [Lachnospiraceae bacterium]
MNGKVRRAAALFLICALVLGICSKAPVKVYGAGTETLYHSRNGYFDLLVRDGDRSGRYRIEVQVGERIQDSPSYSLYYRMTLMEGEDLGITIEERGYATMYDNAVGYPQEVRQYHLPIRFHHNKRGYHFEAADVSNCFQTYFQGMGDEYCEFIVDTNGCGMTNWGGDGLFHNDTIQVRFAPNQYTILYDGNGAAGGNMPGQSVSYDEWASLAGNRYEKSYSVTYDGRGGKVEKSFDQAQCSFLGWQDHNDYTCQGMDYHWYTIDAPYYANHYRDILQAFGYDKSSIVGHYVEHTVNGCEDRQGSASFHVGEYMRVGGEDLLRAFGTDTGAYVSHWNSHGYAENRKGCLEADNTTSDAYPDGAAVRNLTDHINGIVTLTAKWSRGKVTLPSAEREDYELLGWSCSVNAASPDYLPGEAVSVDDDTTFYAVWQEVKHDFNVAYIGNGQEQGTDFVEYGITPECSYHISKGDVAGKPHFIKNATVSFVSAVTGEAVEEKTGQTLTGWSLSKDAAQQGIYRLGEVLTGNALYRQAQQAGNITDGRPAEGFGSYPAGSVREKEEKPVDAPLEYVNLYAVWDCGAVIEAYDLYYTLEEAQTGRITEEELLRHAKAMDQEVVTPGNPQGLLRAGIDEENHTQFVVCDYDAAELQAFEHGGSITETYLAQDEAGNITRKQITVYIVDTAPQDTGKANGRDALRFISRKHLDTLPEDSIWVINEEYRSLLDAVLD